MAATAMADHVSPVVLGIGGYQRDRGHGDDADKAERNAAAAAQKKSFMRQFIPHSPVRSLPDIFARR